MAPPLTLSQSVYAVSDQLFKRAAVEQGGLLSGADPTKFNSGDPLRLWIIQLAMIMGTSQLLSLLLKKLKQPKVISEVIGGIVLGPTLMGRIPHFTQHIFPTDSLPFLSLTANIGLVLFLFLVGLEIETSSIKRNARTSAIISLGGMCLPFGIGAGMAKTIYNNYVLPVTPDTKFTHFMLFTCVAYSITAFPVLCRILSELKLFDTTVGICVLSAGVGNDIIGWTLLALSVALVNASSGITALYIILVAIGWAIVCVFPARKLFFWLAVKTDSLSNSEPSIVFMTCTLLFVFGSAFFTDVIGVHAIFGGFLAGLIVPRENGLAIKMTEKIEDLVGIVFLPLYFALSGLSTNLGLLNTGRIWGFAIAIIVTAWFGKFFGASAGAKFCGFSWREAGAIGELMSCKGLVELIVLNVGLQAGILSTLVFSMFVLEAIVLTFLTTPGVIILYPPHLRRRISEHPIGTSRTLKGDGSDPDEKGKTPGDGPGVTRDTLAIGTSAGQGEAKGRWSNVTVILDRLEHLPGLICVSELLRRSKDFGCTIPPQPSSGSPSTSSDPKAEDNRLAFIATLPVNSRGDLSRFSTRDSREGLSRVTTNKSAPPGYLNYNHESVQRATQSGGMVLQALRLLELSDRTSAVMKSILDSSALLLADPVVSIFKTIHELRGGFVKSVVKVEPIDEWAGVVEETISRGNATGCEGQELVVTCWLGAGNGCNEVEGEEEAPAEATSSGTNPFDFLFNRSSSSSSGQKIPASRETTTHAHFVRSLFAKSQADVALFVDNSSSGESSMSRVACPAGMGGHNTIFLPFFGGPDDRAALEMVIQLCKDSTIRGVIVRVSKGERESDMPAASDEVGRPPHAFIPGTVAAAFEGTISGTVNNTVSQFPDTIYAPHSSATRLQNQTADEIAWDKYTNQNSTHRATSNVEFTHVHSPAPLKALTTIARTIQAQSDSSGRMLLVIGRSRRLAVESHHNELAALIKDKDSRHGHKHLSGEFRKTIGDVASALVLGGLGADMLVLQAGYASASAGLEDV